MDPWVVVMMSEMTRTCGGKLGKLGREERLQGLCPMTPTVSPLHRHLVTLNAPTLHTAHSTHYPVQCAIYNKTLSILFYSRV